MDAFWVLEADLLVAISLVHAFGLAIKNYLLELCGVYVGSLLLLLCF